MKSVRAILRSLGFRQCPLASEIDEALDENVTYIVNDRRRVVETATATAARALDTSKILLHNLKHAKDVVGSILEQSHDNLSRRHTIW